MAAASPLTDPSSSPFGSLTQEKSGVLGQQPDKKPDERPPDVAPSGVVERVRRAVGGGQRTETPPATGEMPKFPTMEPLPPPPKREDTPPIEAWGSLAMLAAALGGLKSRTHATTALNAAGAALQGLHQRDQEKFHDEMDRWKIATDNAQRMQTYEVETYKAVMAQRAQTFNDFIKLSRDQQQETAVQLHAQALAQGNERIAALLEHQQFEETYKTIEAQRKAIDEQKKQTDKIQSAYTMETAWSKAYTAGDQEAKDDPDGWKWKYFPEAAEKAKLPKADAKPDEAGDDRGWWAKYAPSALGGQPAPGAAPQPGASPAPAGEPPDDGDAEQWHTNFEKNKAFTRPGATGFNTELTPREESQFEAWVKSNKVPFDPKSGVTDYDMRGFWKALGSGDPKAKSAVDPNDKRLHYPDYWKTPYHKTFSKESQWANPKTAPSWNNKDQLVAPDGTVLFDDRAASRGATPSPKDSPQYTSGGKHYRYKGTGNYDDPKNWEISSSGGARGTQLADADEDKKWKDGNWEDTWKRAIEKDSKEKFPDGWESLPRDKWIFGRPPQELVS